MRILRNSLLVGLLLFVCLSLPVLADGGRGQVVYPGGSLVVESGDVIQDDVVALGGSLDVREGGRVNGNVTVLGGSASVNGQIDGNLVMLGGSLDLGAHALVDGDLVTLGGSRLVSPEATIRGETIEGFRGRLPDISTWHFVPRVVQPPQPWGLGQPGTTGWFGSWMRALLNTIGMMALGFLLVHVLPKQTHEVARAVTQVPASSIGVGLLTMLLLPIVLVLLAVTCIGIPVAIALALAAAAAGAYGWVAVGAALGQRLMRTSKTHSGPAWSVVVGIGLLSVLSAVPCVGWMLGLIVTSAGLGAVVLTRFGTLQYVHGPPAAPAASSATEATAPDVSSKGPQGPIAPTSLDEQESLPPPASSGTPDGPVQL